jgi:signal transduction histidine kinase/CheY-like chemotaxis protein
MRHLTFDISDSSSYKEAKKETKRSIYTSHLLQLFCGLSDTKEIQKVLDKLSLDFPNAVIIGATTAGEISHAKMYEHTVIVSLSLFKTTKLKAEHTSKIDAQSGKKLSQKLCSKYTKAAVILSEGLKGIDYEGFIKGVKEKNSELIIAGGLAGDNFALKKTYVLFGNKIYKKGAVAVSFSGKKIIADNRYNLNWTPIGKEFTITNAKGNLVKEIDNEDALSIFKRYLGKEVFKNNAAALPDFQMLYTEGETIVSRTPLAVDGNHIIFAGPLKNGEKVQFGFSNAASVISGANLLGEQLSQKPAEAIFIYSCIARKTLLGNILEHEFAPFESIAPTAGFFTYGEFYSTTANNALLNCTTTILVLSESSKNKNIKIKKHNIQSNSLDNTTFTALTHFIEQISSELKDDITKANASEQAKSTFLANMSHEIRTPLNGILGFTDVLIRKELDKETKHYIDIIHQSGQTLLNIVNDILDFSKLENSELQLHITEANLFSQMEDTVATFASVSKNKHLDYHVFIDSNIPKTLKCDIQRLQQVLYNLISNAIKFTPKGGKVQINIILKKIVDSRAFISFSVKDSGIGIEEEKQESVFQAFSQADNSISREFGGTGLGLSISSQYIQMMGSTIELNSTKEEGSEFYFTLELPIIDNNLSITKTDTQIEPRIVVLNSSNPLACTINNIVYTYLDTWNMPYKKISKLDQLQEDDKILIVCSKLFNNKSCIQALDNFEKLELFYIEGAEETFSCEHERFHLLNQPMTGSILFDKIVTLTNTKKTLQTNKTITKNLDFNYLANILVAEDNQTNQMLVELLLQDRNLKYKIVNNGKEALREAFLDDYSIIFMDINMPIMDGITATKLLREKGYTKPIVSLSANVIESDTNLFLEAGVNATLNKPVVPKQLDAILLKYIKTISNDTIDYDDVNLNVIAEALNISDTEVVFKLLKSFAQSMQEILIKVQNEQLSYDLLHNLKGISGNLRFQKIYKLAVRFEKDVNNWDKITLQTNSKIIIAHIEAILQQINLIDK